MTQERPERDPFRRYSDPRPEVSPPDPVPLREQVRAGSNNHQPDSESAAAQSYRRAIEKEETRRYSDRSSKRYFRRIALGTLFFSLLAGYLFYKDYIVPEEDDPGSVTRSEVARRILGHYGSREAFEALGQTNLRGDISAREGELRMPFELQWTPPFEGSIRTETGTGRQTVDIRFEGDRISVNIPEATEATGARGRTFWDRERVLSEICPPLPRLVVGLLRDPRIVSGVERSDQQGQRLLLVSFRDPSNGQEFRATVNAETYEVVGESTFAANGDRISVRFGELHEQGEVRFPKVIQTVVNFQTIALTRISTVTVGTATEGEGEAESPGM